MHLHSTMLGCCTVSERKGVCVCVCVCAQWLWRVKLQNPILGRQYAEVGVKGAVCGLRGTSMLAEVYR
jgi:hypothetical protein